MRTFLNQTQDHRGFIDVIIRFLSNLRESLNADGEFFADHVLFAPLKLLLLNMITNPS